MSLLDRLRGELIDIVEWLDESPDTLVFRFERRNNEIKNGAKLTVRPSQAAVFVNEGKIADVFQPGMYTLSTSNLPILSTLLGWKYGFESPFKAEVYFVNTRLVTDQKWGTRNPVMIRDPELGGVRVRAFGSFAIKVADPGRFVAEIAGTGGRFATGEIMEQARNLVVARFSDAIGEARIPVFDLASQYDETALKLLDRMRPDMQALGLELGSFVIENVSLPEEVEKAIDQRTSMNALGDMNRFMQFQTAQSIPLAAQNPGGIAGPMAQAGLGLAMGAQLGQAFATHGTVPNSPQAAAVPPPLPATPGSFFTAINGQQQGPFGLDQLRALVAQGQVVPETPAWSAGMPSWTPAGQIPSLRILFTPPPIPGSVPPPLPPV